MISRNKSCVLKCAACWLLDDFAHSRIVQFFSVETIAFGVLVGQRSLHTLPCHLHTIDTGFTRGSCFGSVTFGGAGSSGPITTTSPPSCSIAENVISIYVRRHHELQDFISICGEQRPLTSGVDSFFFQGPSMPTVSKGLPCQTIGGFSSSPISTAYAFCRSLRSCSSLSFFRWYSKGSVRALISSAEDSFMSFAITRRRFKYFKRRNTNQSGDATISRQIGTSK